MTISSLTRETLNYIATCFSSGESQLALDVARLPDNGLSPEQQKVVEDTLVKLGEPQTPILERRLLKNRFNGWLYPNPKTDVLLNEKLVARILSYIENLNYSGWYTQKAAHGLVQTSHPRMNQILLRHAFSTVKHFNFFELNYLKKKMRDLDTPDQPVTIDEFFACFPNLERLDFVRHAFDKLNDPRYQSNPERDREKEEVSKAISAHCPKFKGFLSDPSLNIRPFSSVIKTLMPTQGHYSISFQTLSRWAELPHLTELLLNPENTQDTAPRYDSKVFDSSEVFEKFTRLEKLSIRFEYYAEYRLGSLTSSIAKLPLKHLDVRGSVISDRNLLAFAPMTHLETIDLYDCRHITYGGIRAFLMARKPALKRVILEGNLKHYVNNLASNDITLLQTDFPDIIFADRKDQPYPKPDLKHLHIPRSTINYEQLRVFAQRPLESINLIDCSQLPYEAIRAFLRASMFAVNPTLKKVTLDWTPSLSNPQIKLLQSEFSNITFLNRDGRPHSKPGQMSYYFNGEQFA